ncbi:MAG TPA: twin-arginine translocase TatA/TatE family subunit [Verrucomicrobiae bacterium]|nr:twin-arginine translocase TatA/TatE family subunit [Verrucomicrobiae bacterium]
MQAVAETVVMLALFNLGGGEIFLILALVLILFGARKLPGLGRGLRRGIFEFREATKQAVDVTDEAASEAGRSVGGIYGKRAAQALTPDNQVAELYDPAAFQDETQQRKRGRGRINVFKNLWWWIRRFALEILP